MNTDDIDDAISANAAAIAGLGERVDQAEDRFASLNDALAEMSAMQDELAARVTALETPAPPPPPAGDPLEVAWWGRSKPEDVARYAAMGFNTNVQWTVDTTVEDLDVLSLYGVKAYVVLRPEFVGHPAVAGVIVADEPDLVTSGIPKRSIEQVATSAAQARELWPGIKVVSTMGSPCAAGPLSATEAESTDAGYWSVSASSFNTPEADVDRFTSGYGAHVDHVWPQMYTVAGDPVRPRYRRQSPLSTFDAAVAGTRLSAFVAKGHARARRLMPSHVTVGALLSPCRNDAAFGRHPTFDELVLEGRAVIDGGGRSILYFTRADSTSGMPSEALLSDDAQCAVVADAIAELQAYAAA